MFSSWLGHNFRPRSHSGASSFLAILHRWIVIVLSGTNSCFGESFLGELGALV